MMGCLSLFRKQNLKWLGVLATIIMTFVQLGGALVTKTGSEDGCGSSWPLCNGALLPENLPIQTIIELSHRAVSAISLIVVLWLVITAWKNIGYIKEIKPLSIISVGFISSSTCRCCCCDMATKSLCISATFWYFTYQFLFCFLNDINYFLN